MKFGRTLLLSLFTLSTIIIVCAAVLVSAALPHRSPVIAYLSVAILACGLGELVLSPVAVYRLLSAPAERTSINIAVTIVGVFAALGPLGVYLRIVLFP